MSQFLSDIRKMAEEVSSREGCFLYDVEFVGSGGGRTLRVTIDKDAEGGASVDDCSNVSRGLNLLLDVEDVIPGGQYNLEVSTPGLERVLKEPRHFERALGKTVSVKTFAPLLQFNESLPELGKAKTLQGELASFNEQGIRMKWERPKTRESQLTDEERQAEVFIPFETLTKANTVFAFADPQANKPGKGPKKGPKHGQGGHPKK